MYTYIQSLVFKAKKVAAQSADQNKSELNSNSICGCCCSCLLKTHNNEIYVAPTQVLPWLYVVRFLL